MLGGRGDIYALRHGRWALKKFGVTKVDGVVLRLREVEDVILVLA